MSDESLLSVPFGMQFRGVEWVHEKGVCLSWAVVVLEVRMWRCDHTDSDVTVGMKILCLDDRMMVKSYKRW